MNPFANYLSSLQKKPSFLSGTYNSLPATPLQSNPALKGGMSTVPVSNSAATSPAPTKITPPTQSSTSSLQTPAAQTYIQSQTQSQPPQATLPDPTSINIARGNAVAGGQDPYAGAGATPTSTAAGLGNSPYSGNGPSSPYADYVASLKDSRDALNSARLDLASSNSDYTTASTQAHQNTENILNKPGGLLGGAQESAQLQNRHDTANLANLADIKNANANTVTALTQNYATQQPLQIGDTYIDPKTGQILSNKPTEVTPGSGLFNTATGQLTPGSGAPPSQIISTAQQLEQSAQANGTLQYNSDGSINHNAYIQQAQQYYSKGAIGGNSNVAPGSVEQSGQSFQPGTPEFAQSLPNTVYPSYRQTASGSSYFDGSLLDSSGVGTARALAKQYGIPILSGEDAKAVQTVDQAQKNLQLLQTTFSQLAAGSGTGALFSNFVDPISGILQTSRGQALNTYNSNRGALLQQVRALAGSSPRLTGTELNLEENALPTLNEGSKDSLGQGLSKVDRVNNLLKNALTTLIPNAQGQSGQSATGSQSSGGGNVIKTNYGDIDPTL